MGNFTIFDRMNESDVALRLFNEFEGYPIIYPITLYHLYPDVLLGRVVHCIWYVLGLVGNLLSVKLWCSPRLRRASQAAPYLITITMTDILYQIMHMFFYLKYFWGLSSLGVTGLCQIWNVLNLLPQYASQLLVFGFTTERFWAVLRPLETGRFSRVSRIPVFVISIVGTAFLIALPQSLFWTVDSAGFCEMRTSELSLVAYTYWTIVTESVIFIVFPVATLVFNIFVLRYIRSSLKCINIEQVNTNAPVRMIRVYNKCSMYMPTIRTLMLVSVFRIISQLPMSVTYTLQNFDYFNFGEFMSLQNMSGDPQWQRFLRYWGVRMVLETVGASHHALGIFVFCATSRLFRMELLTMFKLKQRKRCKRQPARYHTASDPFRSKKAPKPKAFSL